MSSECQASTAGDATGTSLGDAFAKLVDGLDRDTVCGKRVEALLIDRSWQQSVARLAEALASSALLPGAEMHAAESDQAERLRVLLAIDKALAPVWPGWGAPLPAALVPVRRHWQRTGRLSGDPARVGGVVLLRHVQPARPPAQEEQDTVFRSLVRVDAHAWTHLNHVKIPASHDLSAETVATRSVLVAVCPFTADLDEVAVHTHQSEGKHYYRLEGLREPNVVSDRIRQLIPVLDESGADVAVLPEGVLSPHALATWRSELRATYRSRPQKSRLRWIMVGTGLTSEGEVRNTGVLLHRSGVELGRQHKRYPFTFTQSTDWRVHEVHPGAYEDIDRTGPRTLLESEYGRVAVTICEDLSRPLVQEHGLRQAGPSLLLVPVFNMPFATHNWARTGATQLLFDIGTRAVVVNSLAVAHRWPEQSPWCYGIATATPDPPGSWTMTPGLATGSDALALNVFRVSLSGTTDPDTFLEADSHLVVPTPNDESAPTDRRSRGTQRRSAERRTTIDLTRAELGVEERRVPGSDRREAGRRT